MSKIKIILIMTVLVSILFTFSMSARSKGFDVTGKIYFKKKGDIYIRLLKEKEFVNPKTSSYILIVKLGTEELLKKYVHFKFDNVQSGVYADRKSVV